MHRFRPHPFTRPGKVSLAGAAVVPVAAAPEGFALKPLAQAPDSVVFPPMERDWITPVIQWVFQRSPWVMWGGVALGLVALFFFLRWFWPRRARFATWLRTRSGGFKLVLAEGVVVVLLLGAAAGYGGYHFVETDRRFCNGCHIFVPSGQAMVLPDTGSYTVVPRLEGKHDTLSCHACHPLKPGKEAVKLIFWMSGVRGDSIPEHARVPRAICEQCHVQGAAKETWEAIAATAGHRAHLESDSLRSTIECLTCHARTAHRFPPINQTCGQSHCHESDETQIVLGKMALQDQAQSFHCHACHNFVATVPLLATRDSAAGTLRPALKQCFACHQMKERLPQFDVARDPHSGTCGMCHDPHTQETPVAAAATCTSVKCHPDWRAEPFHTGVTHRRDIQQCITCHEPHAAKVDASDCAGCHEFIRRQHPRLKPPLPFDTLRALQQTWAPDRQRPGKRRGDGPSVDDSHRKPSGDGPLPDERPQKPKGDGPPLDDAPRKPKGDGPPPDEAPPKPRGDGPSRGESTVRGSAPARFPDDTFPHDPHKKLACLECHLTASGRGRLTFEQPRGCQICHHKAPSTSDCKACHQEGDLAPSILVQVSVQVPEEKPRDRSVWYRHEAHEELACTRCHTTRVTMAPADSVLSCNACHSDHHASERRCATCHQTDAITEAHQPPEFAHVACDACHTPERLTTLVPTRSFCLGCHDQAQNHYAPKECSACHFLRTPEEFRRELSRGDGG